MRSYLTVLDGDTKLVPYFVSYYERLGVTEFYVTIFADPNNTEEHVEKVYRQIECCVSPETIIVRGPVTDSKCFSPWYRERLIREVHPPGEWAFFTDLDEFPAITKKDIDRLIRKQAPFIAGFWIDRIADGGKFIDPVPGWLLEESYPFHAKLRQTWHMGHHVYIASPVAPIIHHPPICPIARPHWPLKRLFPVHHFKYQKNVTRRLEDRLLRIIKSGKSKTGWAKNVRRTLAHFQKYGGINPQLLRHCGVVLDI